MMTLDGMKDIAAQAVDESQGLREQNSRLLKHSRKLIDEMRERARKDVSEDE